MANIEVDSAENQIEPGSLEDLRNLQAELSESSQGKSDLYDLVSMLDDTEFTRRVYESFLAGRSYYDLTSGHQALGTLTVAKLDTWGEYGTHNDRLEFFGQKRNLGLLDYTYTIKIPTMHIGGIYDNEIMVDQVHNPFIVRYSRGNEAVVDCIDSGQFDTAAQVIQTALADLIAGLEIQEFEQRQLAAMEEQLLKGVASTIRNFVRRGYTI